MSSFTDSMYEAGFDDPLDYLDYLCAEADYREMMKVDSENEKAFHKLPRSIRNLYKPSCPNCGNHIEVVYEGYECFVECVGFPACKFRKEILYSEDYNSPSKSFRQVTTKWELIIKQIDEIYKCPKCRNKLKKIKIDNFNYIKCDGFPECSFFKKNKVKRKFY